MQLLKFRVRDYKSITDSGDCYPTDRVTIFAGKNEAGKSSVLEALEDSNFGSKIREKAIPLDDPTAKPSIELVYAIDKAEAQQLVSKALTDKEAAAKVIASLADTYQLSVQKSFPDKYSINSTLFDVLPESKPKEWATLVTGLLTILAVLQAANTARNLQLPALKADHFNSEADLKKIEQYEELIRQSSGSLTQDEASQLSSHLSQLKSAISQHASSQESNFSRLTQALIKGLPNFVLFNSFDDVFPNEILLSDLPTSKWIKDLEAISDIDIDVISGNNRNTKKQHKIELNLQLNDDFGQFWTQDFSKLSIDWDNERLEFWIEENNKVYPPELRSQGRRWHLAFYIRVSARARSDVANIILIDKPGLYLHATAQRDILKHLEESSAKCQVMISTHSPYLIEAEKLERVRLVLKSEKKGTYVENKIHAVADKETLSPILTAIGLELNQGIIALDKVNNVVVEGASDYFYLTALNHLLNEFQGNFISGGSSGNMPKVGTILQGWGSKVIYLYDADQAYKDALKSIKKDWAAISSDLLLTLNVEGAIEDIFSKDEFAQILGIPAEEINEKNSAFMKSKKRDKVLPARLYLQKVRANEAPPLSQKTLDIARTLLTKLSGKFADYPV